MLIFIIVLIIMLSCVAAIKFSFFEGFVDLTVRVVFLISIIATILLIMPLGYNMMFGELEYENVRAEREILVERLEAAKENPMTIGNEDLYEDVRIFNEDLRATKRYANNIFLKGLFNTAVANGVDYIPIE